jgi:hypothetical protein
MICALPILALIRLSTPIGRLRIRRSRPSRNSFAKEAASNGIIYLQPGTPVEPASRHSVAISFKACGKAGSAGSNGEVRQRRRCRGKVSSSSENGPGDFGAGPVVLSELSIVPSAFPAG